MILYNVTVNIDHSVHDEWLEWMLTKHIPDVMQTGCFIESRISKVHGEEDGGVTYAIQYLAPNQDQYDVYQQLFAPKLQHEHSMKFQGKFGAFRTVLTIVEEFKK
ncbi:MAG: DUF4286 family protein [Crocinitomicaceae bacterium]|nr:DUF4286 family protein [Crocinitomicaceae bacterium]